METPENVEGVRSLADDLNEVFRLSALGMKLPDIGVSLAISRDLWQQMQKDHPEIHQAYEQGRVKGKEVAMAAVHGRMKAGNMDAAKFWLTNQAPEEWKTRIETNHVVTNDIKTLSTAELERIARGSSQGAALPAEGPRKSH